jgi:hypothetical protein
MIGGFPMLALAALLSRGDLPPGEGPVPLPSQIAGRMGGVAGELQKTETGEPVQHEQKRIVRDLDALIAELEKQCQACRGGIKRNNPSQGMRDSTISAGTGGVGTLQNPGETGKDWAKLSDRERDRILQSMSEGFPPEYRTVLERYYRRLAEEKGAAAQAAKPLADDAGPTEARAKSDQP